jgi:Type I phosphodiesterase / nucleotide pyrophosphatase
MFDQRRRRLARWAGLTAIVAMSAAAATQASAHGHRGHGRPHGTRHVLLLSVDGLHQADLARYVALHPSSAMARLLQHGTEFTRAQTPTPSDSFPGIVAQVTGGDPGTTGVYYDDSYNRSLLPAGTTSCKGATPGTEVTYFEQLDKDPTSLDAGQGLAGLPGSILQMTGDPRNLIDPAQLPVDAKTCQPVYPHSYLRVNTVFEVARTAGLRTAWSDKHAAYDVLNGPSGTGIQDLFTPEINSDAPTAGSPNDWTADNALTQQYDGYKVRAVINEIRGFDHSGTQHVGTPAIFGMNFQTVSTAEKLPTSNGKAGGYLADGVTPGPLLSGALDYVDAQIGEMLTALAQQHLAGSTTVILSAKHGQSPTKPSDLTRIPDGPILDGLNAAWQQANPSATKPLVAFAIDDDAMLLWLSDRSPAAEEFAKNYLLSHDGTGNDIDGNPKPYTASGLTKVFAGQDVASYFHAPLQDDRVPDIYGIAQTGSVYTGKKKKIAEHGGANPLDRDVPLVVAGAGVGRGVCDDSVETTEIAPTILSLLGLQPGALQAVQTEHTPVLRLH